MDDGVVKHCEEQYLISHSGIDIMDIGKYHGILVKFEMLGLITRGRDEMGSEYVQIKNWQKRQEVYSESRNRVRKWREKQVSISDVTPVTLRGNARIEENRIDKNTSVATAPQEIHIEEENTERPKKESRAKYPHSKEVFSWFRNAQKSWVINTTELKHAELLWERGEDKVKKALAYVEKHKDDDFLPRVTKPSDLERKWTDIAEYDKYARRT